MALTDIKVRTSKALPKPYKLADEKGLFLLVTPTGSKYWRFKYRFDGKEKLLAFGVYPDLSLSEAREKRDAARNLLAKDIDPGQNHKAQKAARLERTANSFEVIAREWHTKNSLPNKGSSSKKAWSTSHADKIIRRLEQFVFPWLGSLPITDVDAPGLLKILQRVENRGTYETAHRVHQNCSQIFRYAIATGRANRDPAADLRGALTPVKQQHHASITDPKEITKLLHAIEDYQGFLITKCALKLAPLVFVRPGELRHAEWSEINIANAEWRIPAEKMKAREMHIVPLSKQAIAVLEEAKLLTGHLKYIFPGVRTPNRPMSDNTVTGALRRLGYTGEEMTGHGFRSMASTILNEHGWNRDAIERQLAHSERNKVRAAYNYAEHLPERRKMMQWWADYLDQLKSKAL